MLPVPPPTIRVLSVTDSTVVLAADPKTLAPGLLGVFRTDRLGHASLGPILQRDVVDGSVTRPIVTAWGATLVGETEIICEGDVFAGPEAVDPAYREVSVPTELGDAPAWQIGDATDQEQTWAIHVHGIRTSRIHALRSVPAMRSMGYASLVVSFRGDGDGPPVTRNASMLGQREWRDVAAAMDYAVDHGAGRIVLVGWSLGAGAVLLAAERAHHADRVAGVVLIGPAIEWKTAIRQGAIEMGLPPQVAALGEWGISNKLTSRLVGLPEPISFKTLDWVSDARASRLGTSIFVYHSPGDAVIPVELSRRFARLNAGCVTLIESIATVHNCEYNVDPEAFDMSLRTWLSRLPKPVLTSI